MPLLKRPAPFDHPDWIFELKYDGFRALAVLRDGGAQLISRNGHPFGSFGDLGKQIVTALPGVTDTVLEDSEPCSAYRLPINSVLTSCRSMASKSTTEALLVGVAAREHKGFV